MKSYLNRRVSSSERIIKANKRFYFVTFIHKRKILSVLERFKFKNAHKYSSS